MNTLKLVAAVALAAAVLFGCSNDSNPVQSDQSGNANLRLPLQISVPADATIDSARFIVHATDSTGEMIRIHRVTAGWNENAVTWNSFAGAFDAAALDSFAADTGTFMVDISTLTQGWFDSTFENFGLLLEQGDTTTPKTSFDSRESGQNQPAFEICYTTWEGSFCEQFMANGDAYVYGAYPDSNFGGEPVLYTGRDSALDSLTYSLVRFDFPIEIRYVAIGDRVFEDENQNGIQDAGETGLPGVTVNLYSCDDELVQSTVTDAAGMYHFDSLTTGDYYVEFVAPEDYVFSPADQGSDDTVDSDADPQTGRSECFTLLPSQETADVDAGLFPIYVTIGDYVWMDDNGDGIQDASETGFADVTVNLYTCADELVESTVTDAMGMYMFDSLMPGDYYLEFVTPDGYLVSPKDQGGDDALDSDVNTETGMTDCLTFGPGEEDLTVDAGLRPGPAVIGDFVWNDMNENGIQDDGEPGLEGIKVRLYTCDEDLLDSTMSDADGIYLFDSLDAGDYYLEFVNPFGYIFTLQDQGSDDMLDSDVDRYRKTTVCITVGPGDTVLSWDAGLFAFEGCTYSKGYWKNHAGFGPQADVVTPLLLPVWLGNEDGDKSFEVADAETAVELLQQHEYGHPSDGITKLYAQLLAAKLNIINFANPADIYDVIQDADDFLAMYDWKDWDDLSMADRQMVLQWKDKLDYYNNGIIGPGHCDDDSGEDEPREYTY